MENVMNLSDACVIIERQAKWDGVGILELLQTIEQYGIKEYVANAGLTNEFRQAYYIFMNAGREMFAAQA